MENVHERNDKNCPTGSRRPWIKRGNDPCMDSTAEDWLRPIGPCSQDSGERDPTPSGSWDGASDIGELRGAEMRIYTLFTSGPGGRITNQTGKYRNGQWIATVRAYSVTEAYSHLARQQWTEHRNPVLGNKSNADDPTDSREGILFIYGGPEGNSWPWELPRALDARQRRFAAVRDNRRRSHDG